MSVSQLNGRQACKTTLVLFVILSIVLFYSSFGNVSFGERSTVRQLTIGPRGNIPFPKRIFHLDMKGAPLKISYYEWFFSFLSFLSFDGILIEYEDIFPYSGRLSNISRSRGHYSLDDIMIINRLAKKNRLEVIPLVQTFGHMEFVLKHSEFADLRENMFEDDSICVSDPNSLTFIRELIQQVKDSHPNSKRIHIGSDEAYHVGEDSRCKKQMKKISTDPQRALEKLKIRHIAKVAKICKQMKFTEVFAWNDMFDRTLVEDMNKEHLGSLITPVIWGYATDVLQPNYFPEGLFHRIGQVFDKIWFASAFKGANGKDQAFISIDRYLQNHKSYIELYQKYSDDLEGKVQGIMMTGWQRFKHRFPLSELLPVAIPSLVMNSLYLQDVHRPFSELNHAMKELLNCSSPPMEIVFCPITIDNNTFFPQKETFFAECSFQDQRIYDLVMRRLRLLTWKINNFSLDIRRRDDLKKELVTLFTELDASLSFYYNQTDVNEILAQYLGHLKRQL